MNSTRAWALKGGETVQSLSGRLLGHVGDVDEGAFQLVRDGSELWLTDTSIYTVERTGVILMCEPEGVWKYAVARPGKQSKAS